MLENIVKRKTIQIDVIIQLVIKIVKKNEKNYKKKHRLLYFFHASILKK